MEFTRTELYYLINHRTGVLWLAYADLSEANLEYCPLSGAILVGATLEAANLQHVDLQNANLYGAILIKANLRQANLAGANLQGVDLLDAHLGGAKLTGVQIQDRQFLRAKYWIGATMPDGSHYDGRYRLKGDLVAADVDRADRSDPAAMAAMYKVPLEEYQKGQLWADQNLKD